MSNRPTETKRPQNGPGHGGPMGGMMRGGEKAKDFKGTMRKLVQRLSKYWLAFGVVFVLAIGSTAFMIAGPKILGQATTKLFEGLVAKMQGIPGAAIDLAAYIYKNTAELVGVARSRDMVGAYEAIAVTVYDELIAGDDIEVYAQYASAYAAPVVALVNGFSLEWVGP